MAASQRTSTAVWLLVGLLVASAAVVGVWVGFGGSRGPMVPEPTSTSSTTVADVPSVPQPTAPAIVDTGEDFEAIVRSLIAFNDWIVAHPDPSMLVNTLDASCPCFASTQRNLSDLAVKGWRYDGANRTEVQTVRPKRVAANVVDVFVVLEAEEARIVDLGGQVVDREPAYPPTSYFYTLQRGAEGRWRISQIEFGAVL